jgi:hypothetical protein
LSRAAFSSCVFSVSFIIIPARYARRPETTKKSSQHRQGMTRGEEVAAGSIKPHRRRPVTTWSCPLEVGSPYPRPPGACWSPRRTVVDRPEV